MNDIRYAIVPAGGADVMSLTMNGEVYVPMRPLSEALGLHWQNEHRRLTNDPILSKAVIKLITAFSSGQEQLCLPLTHFHGWLFKLNLNTMNDRARPIVEALQHEGYRVLHDYWTKGQATNPRGGAPSVASIIAMQNHALRLTAKLQRVRNPEERRLMYALLSGMCQQLGVETPTLELLGHDAPTPPDLLDDFWRAIDVLRAAGIEYNHSRTPGTVALNLPQLKLLFTEAKIDVRIDNALKEALRLSTSPRFLDAKAVNSVEGKTVTCWVFELAN